MVFDRPIVVLDEPTASLDAKTEAEVMRNIVDKRPKGEGVRG